MRNMARNAATPSEESCVSALALSSATSCGSKPSQVPRHNRVEVAESGFRAHAWCPPKGWFYVERIGLWGSGLVMLAILAMLTNDAIMMMIMIIVMSWSWWWWWWLLWWWRPCTVRQESEERRMEIKNRDDKPFYTGCDGSGQTIFALGEISAECLCRSSGMMGRWAVTLHQEKRGRHWLILDGYPRLRLGGVRSKVPCHRGVVALGRTTVYIGAEGGGGGGGLGD